MEIPTGKYLNSLMIKITMYLRWLKKDLIGIREYWSTEMI